MLYYLFTYLNELDFPGAGVFQYITFRAAFALISSLIISMVIGKKIIQRLQLLQVGEIVRDLGLQGQIEKQGTPTMGGLIILAAILIPTLLFAKLDNIYIVLMIVLFLDFSAKYFILLTCLRIPILLKSQSLYLPLILSAFNQSAFRIFTNFFASVVLPDPGRPIINIIFFFIKDI